MPRPWATAAVLRRSITRAVSRGPRRPGRDWQYRSLATWCSTERTCLPCAHGRHGPRLPDLGRCAGRRAAHEPDPHLPSAWPRSAGPDGRPAAGVRPAGALAHPGTSVGSARSTHRCLTRFGVLVVAATYTTLGDVTVRPAWFPAWSEQLPDGSAWPCDVHRPLRGRLLRGAENVLHKADLTDGETRTRTGDTTIFSRVLYQLSYLARPGNARGALIPMQPAGTGTIGQWQPVGTSSW